MENFHIDALLWVPELILIRHTCTVYHHHLLRSNARLLLSTASRLCWWQCPRLLSKHIITIHTRCWNKDLMKSHSSTEYLVGCFDCCHFNTYWPWKIHLFIDAITSINAEWDKQICQQISELQVCRCSTYCALPQQEVEGWLDFSV